MILTKTNFMRGLQCPRMLWLDKHKPECRVVSPQTQQRLDQGNAFGDRAMALFGAYEEMTVLRADGAYPDIFAMAEKTREHLARGTGVLCEAAFFYEKTYCAADILRRVGAAYELYEVKNSAAVEPQHVTDTAFQAYVITRCGLSLSRMGIVRRGDDEAHFVIEDVTAAVQAQIPFVAEHITRLKAAAAQQREPVCPMGEHCHTPYPCWYGAYCADR